MHHPEFLCQAEEAFCMAHKKIASGIQAMPKFFDQALLFRFVEIDHDVAAENNVVATGKELSLEIVEVELDELLQLGLDGVFVSGFFKVAEATGVVHWFHLLFGENTFLADAKAGVAD